MAKVTVEEIESEIATAIAETEQPAKKDPLMTALDEEFAEINEELKAQEPVINIANVKKSFFDLIETKGSIDELKAAAEVLKTNGYNFNEVETGFGKTALTTAAIYGNLPATTLLVETYGADVNANDESGYLPITAVASSDLKGVADVMDYYIARTPESLNTKDAKGRTALDSAKEANKWSMITHIENAILMRSEAKANDGLVDADSPETPDTEMVLPEREQAKVTNLETTAESKSTAKNEKTFDWSKASVGGSLTLLKRGTGHKDSASYAQEVLINAGYLQSKDANAENYINPEHLGFMNGNVTVDAIKRAQQDMKDAGADIKVDGKIYTEGWAMLAAFNDNAGKDIKAIAASYEENLGSAREIAARQQAVEALASNDFSEAGKSATEFATVRTASINLG